MVWFSIFAVILYCVFSAAHIINISAAPQGVVYYANFTNVTNNGNTPAKDGYGKIYMLLPQTDLYALSGDGKDFRNINSKSYFTAGWSSLQPGKLGYTPIGYFGLDAYDSNELTTRMLLHTNLDTSWLECRIASNSLNANTKIAFSINGGIPNDRNGHEIKLIIPAGINGEFGVQAAVNFLNGSSIDFVTDTRNSTLGSLKGLCSIQY